MKNRRLVYLFLAAMLVFACNLPAAAPGTGPTTAPITFTPIPVVIATPSATAAGSTVPHASPNDGALNCRTGPDTTYAVAAVLNTGQSVEIVGKNNASTWWYVKNPASPGTFCWISGQFATVTGDISGIQIVAVPPTPTNKPGSTAGAITDIGVSVDPNSIHVAGCIGPIQPVTVFVSIRTNGPMKIKVHLSDQQSGEIYSADMNFKKADFQDFSKSFTPKVNEGKHKITLTIDGLDLKDFKTVTSYTITC